MQAKFQHGLCLQSRSLPWLACHPVIFDKDFEKGFGIGPLAGRATALYPTKDSGVWYQPKFQHGLCLQSRSLPWLACHPVAQEARSRLGHTWRVPIPQDARRIFELLASRTPGFTKDTALWDTVNFEGVYSHARFLGWLAIP
jgi:hypothetical protein